jgi:hypothetical protein
VERGTVYGRRRTEQRQLYETVTSTARDLRRQLEVLNQLAHTKPYDAGDVEAVRAALFAAAGW